MCADRLDTHRKPSGPRGGLMIGDEPGN
ncbi:hypothetical protein TMEG_03725 [Mycobacterium tuberculosis SUMu005]|nr:hypothetical protein TMEG_03725 [Mycobacterium tuberculosis SUMu005]